MFFQKGVFLFLLARSALSFTTPIPQNNVLASNNVAFTLQQQNVFAVSRPKSMNILFSEVSDEATETVEETPTEEPVAVEEPAAEEATPEEEDFKIYIGNLSYGMWSTVHNCNNHYCQVSHKCLLFLFR